MPHSKMSFTVHETSFTKDEVIAIVCGAAGANSRSAIVEFKDESYDFVKVTEKISFFAQSLVRENQDPLHEDYVNMTLGHLDMWGASKDQGNAMALRAAEIIRALLAKPVENA